MPRRQANSKLPARNMAVIVAAAAESRVRDADTHATLARTAAAEAAARCVAGFDANILTKTGAIGILIPRNSRALK